MYHTGVCLSTIVISRRARKVSNGQIQVLRDSVLTGVFDEDVTPLQRASVSAVAAGIAGGATTYTLVCM